MQRRILVVGGAGYIGSHTVRHLLAHGEQVVVLDNLSLGHRESIPNGVRLYQGDLGDRPWVTKLLKAEQITHVMHFAANALVGESILSPLKYYSNNVASTVALLSAMQEAAVKFFIFSSTCATYGEPQYTPIDEKHPQNPINPYGTSKLMVEKILHDMSQQKQIAYAALRYFNAAGASACSSIGEDHAPESHLIPLILQVALGQRDSITIYGNDYPSPDGTCLRDYAHVEDLADAHLRALNYLQAPGDTLKVNLGTGIPFSVLEVIQACRKVTGHPIPAHIAPRRPGDPAQLYADNRLAVSLLGWQPKYTSLETIIATAWNWHKKHPQGFKTLATANL